MAPHTTWLASVALAGAVVLAAAVADAQTSGLLQRERVTSTGGEIGGHAHVADLSAEGRFVAFASDSPDPIKRNIAGLAQPGSRRDGHLVAQIP